MPPKEIGKLTIGRYRNTANLREILRRGEIKPDLNSLQGKGLKRATDEVKGSSRTPKRELQVAASVQHTVELPCE
jgi:hypothetical protein